MGAGRASQGRAAGGGPGRAGARRRWVAAAIVLAVFLAADHLQEVLWLTGIYRRLYDRFPFYVPEGGKSLLQVVLCLAVVRLVWTRTTSEAVRELGMLPRVVQGLAFGLGASAPMFLGFALAAPLAPPSAATAYLAGLSPFAEEVLYRGFACGQLRERARLPAWAAIGLPAVVFGWGHVEPGAPSLEALGLFFLTGSGGILFGWFFLRWGRNLWVPFFLHAGMNLSWELYQVGETALGGWFPFTLQSTTMLLGIVVTLRRTQPIRPALQATANEASATPGSV